MTYQALNFMAAEKLREAEVADPENDARQLVLFAGDMTFDEYTRKMNTEAPPEEEEKLRKATEKKPDIIRCSTSRDGRISWGTSFSWTAMC